MKTRFAGFCRARWKNFQPLARLNTVSLCFYWIFLKINLIITVLCALYWLSKGTKPDENTNNQTIKYIMKTNENEKPTTQHPNDHMMNPSLLAFLKTL